MIVVSEFLAAPGPELLAASGRPVVSDPALWRDADRLRAAVGQAEALIVRNQTRVDADLLAAGPGLRVVGRLGVGLDNIDLAAAKARGIVVTAARNANATAVAEYVLAAMLGRARDLAGADASVRAGDWDRQRFTGTELFGKTLGLVGVGEIGRRVARRAAAFGMRLVGFDPLLGPYDAALAEDGIALMPLDDLLAQAHFVSLHVPLIPATRNLLDARRLALMAPGAVLINSARGGIVDETALLAALEAGRPGHAILDVRPTEPPARDDPLLASPHVTLTPHIAGVTAEAQDRTSRLVVADVMRVLAGERAMGAV